MRHLILLFILVLYTISLNSWARKPAVEPQMGIANEFAPQSPEMAKGFNFNQNVRRAPSAIEVSESSQVATSILVVLFLFAPLLVWGGIQWKSKRSISSSNVIPLRAAENDDDHDQWPKAS